MGLDKHWPDRCGTRLTFVQHSDKLRQPPEQSVVKTHLAIVFSPAILYDKPARSDPDTLPPMLSGPQVILLRKRGNTDLRCAPCKVASDGCKGQKRWPAAPACEERPKELSADGLPRPRQG